MDLSPSFTLPDATNSFTTHPLLRPRVYGFGPAGSTDRVKDHARSRHVDRVVAVAALLVRRWEDAVFSVESYGRFSE